MALFSRYLSKALFIAVAAWATISTAQAATYDISESTGSDVTGDGTSAKPYATINKAVTDHGAGNVYRLYNGTYTSSGNDFVVANLSTGSLSSWTTFQALNDGQVTITSLSMREDATPLQTHLFFNGFKFKDTVGKIVYGDHLFFKNSAFQGGANNGNNSATTIGGNNNGSNLTRYVTFEDCWFFGKGGRYKVITFNSENILFRRCVASAQGGWTFDGSDPEAAFATYNSSNVVVEDLIVMDNLEATYTDFYAGGWYFIRNTSAVPDHDVNGDRAYGFIGINVKDNCFHTDADGVTTAMQMTDGVCINPGNFGFSANSGTTSRFSMNRIGVARHNMFFTPGAGAGMGAFNNSIIATTNTIISSMTTVTDFDGVDVSSMNSFNNGSTTAGALTFNPHTNGWLYPVRIEAGSVLKTAGFHGAQMGPTITTKWGTDGTLYGDSGYESDSGNTLWPWPNEARIKSDLCGVVTYGICATTVTITKYIWEAFGNQIPAEIYAADTSSPTAPGTPSTTTVTSTSIGWTWSASTDDVAVTGYKYDLATDSGFSSLVVSGQDNGSATTATTSGLSASTQYFLRVRAYDATGNTGSNSSNGTGTTGATAASSGGFFNGGGKVYGIGRIYRE